MGEISQAKHFTWRAATLILSLCVYLSLWRNSRPWVIEWWGHGNIHVSRIDLVLIGFHALLNVAWFVPAALLIALNRHVSTAGIYGVSSVLALLLWMGTKHLLTPILGASIYLRHLS